MKRKNQKSQRRSPPKKVVRKDSPLQKFACWGIAGFLIIIVVTLLVVALRNNSSEMTGSSVSVKYYGVSNYPLSAFPGKIQFYITIKQPTLGGLKKENSRVEVAYDIVRVADFPNGMVDAYQAAPPSPIPLGGLDAIIPEAKHVARYFTEDTRCLKEIGDRYGDQEEVKLVLVSDLTYKECPSYPQWLSASARHSFYTDKGELICSQDGGMLFSLEKKSGATSRSLVGC